jgi:hypothetical protein
MVYIYINAMISNSSQFINSQVHELGFQTLELVNPQTREHIFK